MTKKQKIFLSILLIIYILLIVWCFFIEEYKEIIKSICILIGSCMLGNIFINLEDKNDN
jgi:hypothetical protein|nr:MAG TPA: Lipopolysaccharide export system ATP-binding protein transport, ABC-transporter, LIPID TRANSPORT [Caudoviricetes sp.]